MKTQLRKRSQGFTIIEVMIVLAIAGLILAVILLAVPALQRSQRNNARQNDATHLAGLVSDYISNHGGIAPPAAANCNTVYTAGNENFSQLTGCAVKAQSSAGASTTTFIVDTGTTCVAGSPTNVSDVNSFSIAWLPESAAAGAVTCITG